MALWCMDYMRFLIVSLGMFRSFNFIMECSWMAPWTFALIVINGFTIQPRCFRMSMRGLWCF